MHPYSEATQKLHTFLSDPRTLNVVHYACESFYGKTSPIRVCAISVMNVQSGNSSVMSVHRYCLDHNIVNPAELLQDADEYKKAETWLLEEFFDYAKKQGDAGRWLHWNMNSESFGFAHLEQRYKQLTVNEPYHISAPNRLDLDDALGKIYGQNYMCDMKMLNIVKQNALSKQNFKTGSEEAFAFSAADWKLIHDSTHEKIAHILAIARLASSHNLKTHTPNWKAHLGGWFAAQRHDHPLITLFSAGLTLIGFVASVMQILSALPHK